MNSVAAGRCDGADPGILTGNDGTAQDVYAQIEHAQGRGGFAQVGNVAAGSDVQFKSEQTGRSYHDRAFERTFNRHVLPGGGADGKLYNKPEHRENVG
jgi:hypothetical protein